MKAAPVFLSFFERLRKPESILICILLTTAILRFAFLDLKLYHHDEAVHAWFAYKLLTEGTYIYDPVFHGPFLFYVTAGLFSIFGDTDLVGRLLPAILGTALVALVYPLYRLGYIDGRQMVIAGLFLAISPNMVYFSRFLRNDIFIAFFSLLLVVAALAYFQSGKARFALVAGLAAGLGMSSKENMPIVLVIFGAYLVYALQSRRLIFPKTWRRDILSAALLGGSIMAIFYSSFGAHPEIVLRAGQMAISHWTEMHGIERLGGPWYYYLILFVLYEVPILILAAVGILRFTIGGPIIGSVRSHLQACRSRRDASPDDISCTHPSPPQFSLKERLSSFFRRPEAGRVFDPRHEFIRFCIWWMIASLAVYAYIGEKVPWLILHQLLPMIFVATYFFSTDGTKDGMKYLKAVVLAVALLFLAVMTMHVAFTPADISEPIVQVQNSEELRELMVIIDESDNVAIATSTFWPLPWYYRGDQWSKFTYYGEKPDAGILLARDFDLIIAHDRDSFEELPGYEKTTMRHSYWLGYHQVNERLIPYYFTRQAPVGSIRYDLFTQVSG